MTTTINSELNLNLTPLTSSIPFYEVTISGIEANGYDVPVTKVTRIEATKIPEYIESIKIISRNNIKWVMTGGCAVLKNEEKIAITSKISEQIIFELQPASEEITENLRLESFRYFDGSGKVFDVEIGESNLSPELVTE